MASSQLVYPEARAALAAAERAGRLDGTAYDQAVAALDLLYDDLQIIGVDDQLAHEAGDLAVHYALRGYDAMHLASALALDANEVVLATWDAALSRAADQTGRLLVNRL